MHTKKNTIMKKVIILIAVVFTLQNIQAQDEIIKDSSLKRLILSAVNNFPKIKELQEQLNATGIKAQLINSNFKPTINADAGYQFVAPVPEVNFGAGGVVRFQPYNNYAGSISLKQLVYDFGKTTVQLERNNVEAKLTSDNIEIAQFAIAYQVAQLYANAVFTLNAVTVQETQIKTLQDNERLIQAKIDNGDALKYDLLTTKVRTSNSTNRLEELKGNLDKYFSLIEWLTGENISKTIDTNIQTKHLMLATSSSLWEQKHPEAQLINHKLDLLSVENKMLKYSNKPSVFASASTGFRNGIQPDINQFRLTGGAGIGISIPIVPASRPKLQQQLIAVNTEATKKSLQTLAYNVQKDLIQIASDHKTISIKLENTLQLIEQAEQAFALAKIRYKEGLITNIELLGIQNNVEDAQLLKLQYQFQLLNLKLESHKIAGTHLY
jgi:outer membrane protein TolC